MLPAGAEKRIGCGKRVVRGCGSSGSSASLIFGHPDLFGGKRRPKHSKEGIFTFLLVVWNIFSPRGEHRSRETFLSGQIGSIAIFTPRPGFCYPHRQVMLTDTVRFSFFSLFFLPFSNPKGAISSPFPSTLHIKVKRGLFPFLSAELTRHE